jgi:Fe-S oxidoreductase
MAEECVKLDVSDISNFRYDMKNCIRCKGCKWVDHIYMPGSRFSTRCPSEKRYLFDSFSAWGRLRLALGLMDKQVTFSQRFVEAIYKCQLCGACDAGCKRNLDLEIASSLEALRIKCVDEGHGPMPEHKDLAEKIENEHNVFGAPSMNREKWIKDNKPVDKADVIYFVGCYASYKMPEISRATTSILNMSGQGFKVLGNEEFCCGYPLYSTGQIEKAKRVAEHNIEAIRNSGSSTVLTSCAECYKTIKVDYPKILGKSTADMGYRVIHLVEYVAEAMQNRNIEFKNSTELRLTYHDSCNLARMSEPWIYWEGTRGHFGLTEPPMPRRRGTYGLYKQPRDILRNVPGIDFVEMHRIRENAWCCGAGGGVKEAFPDFANWTAGERLSEVKDVGAEALVTTCPRCKENFSNSIKASGDSIKVYDISEIIKAAIS